MQQKIKRQFISLEGILAVDPGTGTTGWAYWNADTMAPIASDNIKPTHLRLRLSNVDTLMDIWNQFDQLISIIKPKRLIIEDITLYSGSAKSHAAAVKGDLSMTATLAGGMCCLAWKRDVRFENIDPRWNGQRNDAATKAQVETLTERRFRTHEADAVGLGLWYAGRLA